MPREGAATSPHNTRLCSTCLTVKNGFPEWRTLDFAVYLRASNQFSLLARITAVIQSSHSKGKHHSMHAMLPCPRLVPSATGSQVRLQNVSIAVGHSDCN